MRIILLFSIAAALLGSPSPKAKKPAKPAAKFSMTGCVDQRDEKYVLTEDADLKRTATLKGGALSEDNLARFVGHKVRVEGSSEDVAGGQTIAVDKVVDIADHCSDH